MNCTYAREADLIARYLSGDLDEPSARELEEHYFTCDDCLEELKDLLALRRELAHDRYAVRLRPKLSRKPRRWPWLAVAAVILIGICALIVVRYGDQSSGFTSRIESLASIDPPPWEPRSLRGPVDDAERSFRDAMIAYQDGEYAGAIQGLRAAAELDPGSVKIHFYLGACYLLEDEPAPAIESLDRVVAAGPTPFLEHARLFRAKAFLRTGQLEAARRELQEIAGSGNKPGMDARRLLERLRE